MNINPSSNNSTNISAQQGPQVPMKMPGGGLGGAAIRSLNRVPYAPFKPAPQKMPTENNPFKNLFRDSVSNMSPEAAREVMQQRRTSLAGVLGGMVGRVVGQIQK